MKSEARAKKGIFLGLDGADPLIMKKLISEGYLPNLKKFMEGGTTTEDMGMLGVHPTITPPNWCTLATGAYPSTHGITCFWNHKSGNPLNQLDHGFNSELCKAEYIWDAAARAGKKSIVFNYPTGWPATNENVIAIDGSGINPNTKGYIDYDGLYAAEEGDFSLEVLFHDGDSSGTDCMVEDEVDTIVMQVKDELKKKKNMEVPGSGNYKVGSTERVNPKEAKIDRFKTPISDAKGWSFDVANAKQFVLPVNTAQQRRIGLIVAEDGEKYNKLVIYASKKDTEPVGEVKVGEWSEWIYDTYREDGEKIPVAYKVKLMSLAEDGSKLELYRSFTLDLRGSKWFYPLEVGPELYKEVGPMIHMSNCGRDDIQIETQAMMHEWYTDALLYLTKKKEWDLLYMHCHALDICNHEYQNKILPEYSGEEANYYLYDVLLKYYEMVDRLVGRLSDELLNGENAIVLASDHGGMSNEHGCEIPLMGDPWAVGGKVMEDLGYLVINRDKDVPEIDWTKTRAIDQRSGYIYINLKGREPHGIVEPEDYDKLVEEIIDNLLAYRDETDRRPVNLAIRKQDMPVLGLGGENTGDIYFVLNPSFTRVHGTSLTTASYKFTSVKCYFAIAGAGVKKGERMNRSVRAVDVVPTICELMGIPVPKNNEGGVIYQALED